MAQLLRDATKYVKNQIAKSDKSLQNVDGTLGHCSKFFELERFFVSGAYAVDVPTALENLGSFVNNFDAEADYFENAFNRFGCANNEILQDTNDFCKNADLRHQYFVFGNGCEYKLNALKRDLSNLVRQTRTNTAKLETGLKGAKCALGDIRKVAKEIKSVYNSALNKCGDKISFGELKKTNNNLFLKVYKAHWPGHLKFISVQGQFQEILNLFSSYAVALDCVA